MPDNKYCYPDSNVLINNLNIRESDVLFEAEKELTAIRLRELQISPVEGNYDFEHLKKIHRYIFQDVYEWAGEVRTVEIGKGNLFCTTACIQEYAESVFAKYYSQCLAAKDDRNKYIKVFAENYGDLNALHPFREGNGRAQREFARLVCMACGYTFNLSHTTHKEMLHASILSFDKGDSSEFIKIFSEGIIPIGEAKRSENTAIEILTADDMIIGTTGDNDYYGYVEIKDYESYNAYYKEKIEEMNNR